MDYLCELPHDAARRKALNNLPRGLTPTYERILRRINESDIEVQKLAQRTFRWLYFASHWLNSKSICQAVAIEIADSRIDDEALPDEADILRHCGSLIRRSADGEELEFAHFTAKEFFTQLGNGKDNEFTAYVMDAEVVKQELAKVCLTYITMPEFDHCKVISLEAYETEIEEHPFSFFADWRWSELVRDWHDNELVQLLKKFFDPSKKGVLISWAQRELIPKGSQPGYDQPRGLAHVVAGIKEATPLHFASMLALPDICEWLLKSGIDVDSWSTFGTPLQCAIITDVRFSDAYIWRSGEIDFKGMRDPDINRRLATVDILLEAGSNPNILYKTGEGDLSTLTLALRSWDSTDLAVRLFNKGALFSIQDLDFLCELCEDQGQLSIHRENILLLAQRMSEDSSSDSTQEIVLRRALMSTIVEGESDSKLLLSSKINHKEPTSMEKAELEISMRTAAKYGQLNLMTQLLEAHFISVNAACESTGKTAVHQAAANDHLEILKALFARGADLAVTDLMGRSAMHHGINRAGNRCLPFLIEHDFDVNLSDHSGMTAWHETVSSDNLKALKMLACHKRYQPSAGQNASQLPLSFAAKKATSVEFLSVLISAGCSVQDVDMNGYTAFHNAAEACSVNKMRFLLEHGSDISAVSQDGSSPLHLAVRSKGICCYEAISYLIDKGSDRFLANHCMLTPVDIWIKDNLFGEGSELATETLQVLVQPREPDLCWEAILSKPFLNLCQLGFIDRSSWFSIALETLLKNGAELTKRNDADKMAFCILLVLVDEMFISSHGQDRRIKTG